MRVWDWSQKEVWTRWWYQDSLPIGLIIQDHFHWFLVISPIPSVGFEFRLKWFACFSHVVSSLKLYLDTCCDNVQRLWYLLNASFHHLPHPTVVTEPICTPALAGIYNLAADSPLIITGKKAVNWCKNCSAVHYIDVYGQPITGAQLVESLRTNCNINPFDSELNLWPMPSTCFSLTFNIVPTVSFPDFG